MNLQWYSWYIIQWYVSKDVYCNSVLTVVLSFVLWFTLHSVLQNHTLPSRSLFFLFLLKLVLRYMIDLFLLHLYSILQRISYSTNVFNRYSYVIDLICLYVHVQVFHEKNQQNTRRHHRLNLKNFRDEYPRFIPIRVSDFCN